MSKTAKVAGTLARNGADLARLTIVLGCAGALILAGQALPF